MKVLVINCGSSSIKYQVIDTDTHETLVDATVERVSELEGGHAQAIGGLLASLGVHELGAVGHRVVHGGERFFDSALITDDVLDGIEACVDLAPLHNPANLAGIRAAMESLPQLPHVAVFDTAFHARMPARARTYALDAETASAHGIRRYGFHGTSHAYVAELAARHLGRSLDELRLVTCHLGNGASVCAIEFGHSVETSMGMTPLEGLVMGTRCGDLDPGVVIHLCRKLGVDAADELLNRKSGLAGLSGLGNDLRDIEANAADGHEGARRAISVFSHRVRKYIGAYVAVMGGVDAVVLTGGIGENAVTMRRRILQSLDVFGLVLDEHANEDCRVDDESPVADISMRNSRTKALVIATNEEARIAQEVAKVVGHEAEVPEAKPIPIAISARHAHLDRAAMDALFGPGSELEVYREISQPGEFASKQCVNLIGPRDRIGGVRVLGPLRAKCQIEISRTDEFMLGVDAPIRNSGKTAGSAPITLEGPAGTVSLKEGLICARRHIHMHPDDAKVYGVKSGDEVEVAVTGGARGLVFGDVLVRVKDSYRLEMHIDTDEANAAELSRGATGDFVYSSPKGPAKASLTSRRKK